MSGLASRRTTAYQFTDAAHLAQRDGLDDCPVGRAEDVVIYTALAVRPVRCIVDLLERQVKLVHNFDATEAPWAGRKRYEALSDSLDRLCFGDHMLVVWKAVHTGQMPVDKILEPANTPKIAIAVLGTIRIFGCVRRNVIARQIEARCALIGPECVHFRMVNRFWKRIRRN